VREYQEVIRLNPRHATSHVNLGVMLARQNRIAEAIEHFEEALRIDPGYKEAGEYLAKTRGHQPRVP
jgi:tetratricopeptide (TPR) repeat protein